MNALKLDKLCDIVYINTTSPSYIMTHQESAEYTELIYRVWRDYFNAISRQDYMLKETFTLND